MIDRADVICAVGQYVYNEVGDVCGDVFDTTDVDEIEQAILRDLANMNIRQPTREEIEVAIYGVMGAVRPPNNYNIELLDNGMVMFDNGCRINQMWPTDVASIILFPPDHTPSWRLQVQGAGYIVFKFATRTEALGMKYAIDKLIHAPE